MSQTNIINAGVSNSTQSLETIERNLQEPTYLKPVIAKKKGHPIPLINHIFEHLTTVAHVGIVGVTIYIVWLSSRGFEFFNWHPILYSIGWMLLMTEALLMLTKDNIFSNRITYTWRVRWHWMMQVVAIAMSLAGFIIIFIYEDGEDEHGSKGSHFGTSHGLYGLISMILGLIPTCLSGIPALFSFRLRAVIPPKINKFIHATSGIASVVFGGVTMVLSLYTGWFTWKTNGDEVTFTICYIAIVFGIVWALVRPLITSFERIKGFIQ